MSRTTRAFIALPLPVLIKNRLERLQRLIAPGLEGARWAEPASFHVTLAFLGDVDDTDLNRLCKAVATAVVQLPPVALTVRGLGAFPDVSKPRVLWSGLSGDLDGLAAVQKAVAGAATGAGYRPQDDRFHPHVTLGRLKVNKGPGVDLSALEAHYRAWAAGIFTAESVVTLESTMTPEGPAYAPLGIAPLAKAVAP